MNPATIFSTVIFQVSYYRKSLFFNIDKCQYPSAVISVFNNLKRLFLGIKQRIVYVKQATIYPDLCGKFRSAKIRAISYFHVVYPLHISLMLFTHHWPRVKKGLFSNRLVGFNDILRALKVRKTNNHITLISLISCANACRRIKTTSMNICTAHLH